jgi:uncharacterized secreted protein with C-terminal beta-propeller domain
MKLTSILMVVFIGLFIFGCFSSNNNPPVKVNNTGYNNSSSYFNNTSSFVNKTYLKSFGSWEEISELLDSTNLYNYFGIMKAGDIVYTAQENIPDFSKTNVQVSGVDEADIVKTDGQYIYLVSSNKVLIFKAYPPSEASVVSSINLTFSPFDLFVYNDTLVVFERFENYYYIMPCFRCFPYRPTQISYMKIYNISDKATPKLIKEIKVEGNYLQSRLIDGKVYAIFNSYINREDPMPIIYINNTLLNIEPKEIGFFDYPDQNYVYTILIKEDLTDYSNNFQKIFVTGSSDIIYVSQNNIYLTYSSFNNIMLKGKEEQLKAYLKNFEKFFSEELKNDLKRIDSKNISDWRKTILKINKIEDFINKNYADLLFKYEKEFLLALNKMSKDYSDQSYYAKIIPPYFNLKTIINKISLDGEFLARGEVPGTILNQFSMDEFKNYFRIVTTTVSDKQTSNVYILDDSLSLVGKLEGLSPKERLYSSLFIGNKLYLVTFKQIDPFFVIDLSDPLKPKILGELKIPGYSSYLHPYDENHIIGIGKEIDENIKPDEPITSDKIKGLKLSIFDVSDSPKEIAKYIIEGKYIESLALNEHKAFLFSKEKNLLAIPFYSYRQDKYDTGLAVFNLSTENGFSLKGNVLMDSFVQRSLYIGNYLYTISGGMIKINDLGTLEEQKTLLISKDFPPEEPEQ